MIKIIHLNILTKEIYIKVIVIIEIILLIIEIQIRFQLGQILIMINYFTLNQMKILLEMNN